MRMIYMWQCCWKITHQSFLVREKCLWCKCLTSKWVRMMKRRQCIQREQRKQNMQTACFNVECIRILVARESTKYKVKSYGWRLELLQEFVLFVCVSMWLILWFLFFLFFLFVLITPVQVQVHYYLCVCMCVWVQALQLWKCYIAWELLCM